MISADGSFLDRLCDRAAQPVNPQSATADSGSRARSAAVWPALKLKRYHNAGHKYTHLRISLLTFYLRTSAIKILFLLWTNSQLFELFFVFVLKLVELA